MNKSKFPANSYIGSIELKSISEFIENNFHFLLSGLLTNGLLIRKLPGGGLDTQFQVTANQLSGDSWTINIQPGYLVKNYGGIMRIFEFKGISITIDSTSYPPPATYKVALTPLVDSYEQGTLSFEQGSDMVSISNGTFEHLRPYGSIIIDDETFDGASLEVIEVSTGTARLAQPYPSASVSGVKWKVGARFASNTVPPDNNEKLEFEYEVCTSVITQKSYPLIIAELNITGEPGEMSVSVSDYRLSQLASLRNNAICADDVFNGANKDITTIEEKFSAGQVSTRFSDFFSKGIRSGGALNVQIGSGDSGSTLKVDPLTAYDGLGSRIQTASTVFYLDQLVSDSVINLGLNFLYVYYKSPGSYDFMWNIPVVKPQYVYVCEVNYDPSGENKFTAEASEIKTKVKAVSLISEGKVTPNPAYPLTTGIWNEGEIYYNPNDNLCYYVKKSTDGGLEAVKLVTPDIVTEMTKYTEKLRFVFYPFDDKDNWFLFNGMAAPCPIGYPFTVLQWKIGVLDTDIFAAGNNSIVDYMAGLGGSVTSNKQVATSTCSWRYVSLRTLGLSYFAYNSALGLYYHGTSAAGLVELRVNGNIVDLVNMESSTPDTPGTPPNKLYSAEVTIQYGTGSYSQGYQTQQD
jgi:hypothetical protein